MQRPQRSYTCIHRRFEAQVLATPDAIALASDEMQVSYRELNRRANQLAHYLQQRGVQPDVLVGICTERSPDLVIGLLGILKAGGAYVALDPLFPRDRLAFMLEDTQVPVLLTQERLRAGLPACHAMIICLDADWAPISHEDEHNPTSATTVEHLAYITYTSGSTGQPKGAAIPHRSIIGFMDGVDYLQMDAAQTFLHYSSISWDALTLELWPALAYGARCVLYPAQLPTPYDLVESIRAQRISLLWLTVALFNAIIDSVPEGLSGVAQLLIGGEVVSITHVRRALECLPATQLVNGYGPSECTVVACCYVLPRRLPDDLAAIPIGRPIGDRAVYLLDAHFNRTPIGVPGELFIGGPAVARSYHNRPALTAEKILPNPFSKTAGGCMYRTGDLARYRPDGMIEFVGRIDYQVKIRGFRIELEEIETVLGQHPAIREVAVIVREDSPGEKRLVAYIVTTKDERRKTKDEPDPSFVLRPSSFVSELRAFLIERLPDYMIPSAFVLLDALPLTPNGKVNRRALPAPPRLRSELDSAFVAPRTPLEELLAGIWADVLDLDYIGIHDDFFALGGQSLLAARVMARVREASQLELPIRAIFDQSTVASLAEYIAQAYPTPAAPALPIQPALRNAPLPLSFAQQRLWFFDQLEPGSALYNVPVAVQLSGPLELHALRRSLTRIVQRHESLRTTFVNASGQPYQLIAPEAPSAPRTPLLDLRALPPELREAALRRLAISEARRPFDLARGPLLRTSVVRLAEAEHALLLTMHHIISDGWSMGVFIQELAALYDALTGGAQAALPELPIQYADFAIWQREWLQGEGDHTGSPLQEGDHTGSPLQEHLAYWRRQLADAPPLLHLPLDRPRPAVQTFQGATHAFALPGQLARELTTLSRRAGVTLFMTLLASFKLLLHWYSGQDDIVVGSPIAGRSQAAIEPLIGFFVNTLVLRTDLSGLATFQDLLRRIREVTLSAYAHQDVPFERLVEELQPERSLGHMPLFQVWFVLQNAPQPPLALPDLAIRQLDIDYGMARYDLRLGLAESADWLSGTFEYNSDLFDAATIARMAGLFEALLGAIAARPDMLLDELKALLNEASQQHQRLRQAALKATSLQKLRQVKRQSVRGI